MSSDTDPGASWPPAPERQQPAPAALSDGAEEALHHGWRLLALGLCCAPPVFLPLAVWQGIAANKARSGTGNSLLLATGAVGFLWLGIALLANYLQH